jgi:ATP-dependent DNA helicase RecG
MAIPITDLTPEEITGVLMVEEDHFTDVKAIEIQPARLTRTISAFANADAGELLIGVDEDTKARKRTWRGFSNVEAANGHIQAFEQIFPVDNFVDYQFLRDPANPQAGFILKASIQKSPDIRRATDGIAYLRRGAQNLSIGDEAALKRLEYAKGVRSYETHPVDAPVDFITRSASLRDFMQAVVPTSEPEPWLRKQLLIRDDKPTVASILLFADEPQAVLPKQSTVKVYRYATTDPTGTRATLQGQPTTIEGNSYNAIHEAVGRTVDTVEGLRMMGPSGMEPVQYPEVTLHEIITNAVLHRDYSVADDIHVRVFDNRIEVESPGRLPAHVTTQNILMERFARNGVLVRWINKFPDPPNKDVGEGLRTAFDAMRSLKLKPPEITQTTNAVVVVIRHERLASPEEMILEYLQKNPEISNSIVRDLTGIGSENKVKRIFQRMIKTGELESIPGRSLRDAAYRLPSNTHFCRITRASRIRRVS